VAKEKKQRISILQIRRAIDSCNWVRNDLTGGTRKEFIKQNIPGGLQPHIERLRAMRADIPASKVEDLSSLDWAIESAGRTIQRWHESQPADKNS
jgi:hypothetical protein